MFSSYLLVACFLAWSLAASGRRTSTSRWPILIGGLLSLLERWLPGPFAGITAMVLARPARGCAASSAPSSCWPGSASGCSTSDFEPLQQAVLGRAESGRGAPGGAAMKGFGERFPLWLDAFYYVRTSPTGIGPGQLQPRLQRSAISGSGHSAHTSTSACLRSGALSASPGGSAFPGVVHRDRAGAERVRRGYRPLATDQLSDSYGALSMHAVVIGDGPLPPSSGWCSP